MITPGAYTDVYSRMYPNLMETAAIGGETGSIYACGPAEAERIRSMPFLMCEYAHAMGNGPGRTRGLRRPGHALPTAARRIRLGVA